MDRPTRMMMMMMMMMLLSLPLCMGERPHLIESSVWYTNLSITNVPFEYAIVKMKFNEPLFVTGNTFLCSSADKECPPLSDCKVCDWSGQNVLFQDIL